MSVLCSKCGARTILADSPCEIFYPDSEPYEPDVVEDCGFEEIMPNDAVYINIHWCPECSHIEDQWLTDDTPHRLRTALAEKDGRIAALEEAINRAKESLGYLRSNDFKHPEGDADKQAWKAYSILEDALTPPSAAADVLRAARETLACIVLNAKIGPDASMGGTTDCYHVPLDDIDAAKEVLSKMEGQ